MDASASTMPQDELSSSKEFREFCEKSGQLLKAPFGGLDAVDEFTERSLLKVDESCALLDVIRKESDTLVDSTFPQLLANTEEIEKLFLTIDLIEPMLSQVQSNVDKLEKRLHDLKMIQGSSDTYLPASVRSVSRVFKAFSIPVKLHMGDDTRKRTEKASGKQAVGLVERDADRDWILEGIERAEAGRAVAESVALDKFSKLQCGANSVSIFQDLKTDLLKSSLSSVRKKSFASGEAVREWEPIEMIDAQAMLRTAREELQAAESKRHISESWLQGTQEDQDRDEDEFLEHKSEAQPQTL